MRRQPRYQMAVVRVVVVPLPSARVPCGAVPALARFVNSRPAALPLLFSAPARVAKSGYRRALQPAMPGAAVANFQLLAKRPRLAISAPQLRTPIAARVAVQRYSVLKTIETLFPPSACPLPTLMVAAPDFFPPIIEKPGQTPPSRDAEVKRDNGTRIAFVRRRPALLEYTRQPDHSRRPATLSRIRRR